MMSELPGDRGPRSKNALDDVTVVEFGGYAAGPAIGKYLANFGARVIHVESMSRPDGFRLQYPPYKDDRVGIERDSRHTQSGNHHAHTVETATPLLGQKIEQGP